MNEERFARLLAEFRGTLAQGGTPSMRHDLEPTAAQLETLRELWKSTRGASAPDLALGAQRHTNEGTTIGPAIRGRKLG